MRAAWLLGVFVLGGCASQIDEQTMAAARAPLTCATKAQCEMYWQRAQVWVSTHSAYRIQSATDAVISTYGPFGGQVGLAFQVLRLPRSDGSATIQIAPSCDNVFGCEPRPAVAAAQFKDFVRRGD